MEFREGDKVRYGSGSAMIIGTVKEITQPQPPYFIQWVSLKDIVKKNGEPSKKYKTGVRVQAKDIKLA